MDRSHDGVGSVPSTGLPMSVSFIQLALPILPLHNAFYIQLFFASCHSVLITLEHLEEFDSSP